MSGLTGIRQGNCAMFSQASVQGRIQSAAAPLRMGAVVLSLLIAPHPFGLGQHTSTAGQRRYHLAS